MSAARLLEIETKLAYQEDTLQALNEVVTRQQREIDELRGVRTAANLAADEGRA